MILPVSKIIKERKEEKRGRIRIRVGSLVTTNVDETDKKTMHEEIRKMSKKLVVCVQASK